MEIIENRKLEDKNVPLNLKHDDVELDEDYENIRYIETKKESKIIDIEHNLELISRKKKTCGISNYEKLNDFIYISGYGFYLNGYLEVVVDDRFNYALVDRNYREGELDECTYEITDCSDMFKTLTSSNIDDYQEHGYEFSTLKIRGVDKSNFVKVLEKCLFKISFALNDFEPNLSYIEMFYPTIIDIRNELEAKAIFQHTLICENINWNAPGIDNIALFNFASASGRFDFFNYYRFIETFFSEIHKKEIIALTRILSELELNHVLIFCRDKGLINANAGVNSLAKTLYEVRNNYCHSKTYKERKFYNSSNLPFDELFYWRTVTREISTLLVNKYYTFSTSNQFIAAPGTP